METERNTVTNYLAWEIHPVFNYTNGKSDWQIYPEDGEHGEIIPSMTLEELKSYIDEKD